MGSSIWKRFLFELRPSYPLFSLEEAACTEDLNGSKPRRYIDVKQSFAPHWMAISFRLFFLAWSLQVLYTDVSTYPPHNLYIYMGYLTHWGHFLSNLYFLCSFLCTIIPWAVRQPTGDMRMRPGRLVRTTWGLYSCVAPLEIAITLLYWSGTTFISGHGTYVSAMEHGGIALLILIDGLLVGIVPVRAKHLFYLVVVSFCYLSWSVFDAFLEIGNGEWGPAYEDDALYPVLNWNQDRKGATIVSAFVICVLSPGLFFGCWALSLLKSKGSSNSSAVLVQGKDGEIVVADHGCCSAYFDGSRRPLYPLEGTVQGSAGAAYIVMEEDKEFV